MVGDRSIEPGKKNQWNQRLSTHLKCFEWGQKAFKNKDLHRALNVMGEIGRGALPEVNPDARETDVLVLGRQPCIATFWPNA